MTTGVGPTPLAADTLIFRVSPAGFALVGGAGRGVGWSGIVDLPLAGEPLAARAHASSRPARVGGSELPYTSWLRNFGSYDHRQYAMQQLGAGA